MEDIDQSRFALTAAITRASEGRPDEYPDYDALLRMSDQAVRAYAVGLLQMLENAPGGDSVEVELQTELRLILGDAP
jgi:hypothetical protein